MKRAAFTTAVLILLFALGRARAAEPAITMLADFEDPSVAAKLNDLHNILAADCAVRFVPIPARGKGSLAVEVNATQPRTSVAVDLTLREPIRFRELDRVAVYCWINEGAVAIGFRLHDAADQLFETPAQEVKLTNRWVAVSMDWTPEKLTRLRGSGPPAFPLEVEGLRLTTDRVGKQTVFLDELQVEHRVEPRELIRGEFRFNEPTRIYEPNSTVAAMVVLENRSRSRALNMTVDLAWTRPDGVTLQNQTAKIELPPSGVDFRSARQIDFSQAIREPGVYRLVARARAPGWVAPNTFETSIAVAPSNRRLSRGRSTLFGVQTNLLREPALDQQLELSVARDLGVNVLALTAGWDQLEPRAGALNPAALEPVLNTLGQKDVPAMLVLVDPPEWAAREPAQRAEELARFIAGAAGQFGGRLQRFQVTAAALGSEALAEQLQLTAQIQERVAKQHPKVSVLPPPIDVASAAGDVLRSFAAEHADLGLQFRTQGPTDAALRALDEFRKRAGYAWRPVDWWLHDAAPLVGAGAPGDAEAVLRHYVGAAAAGVAGLMWFDLRDDDNDPEHPEAFRGLVRRDFSPRTTLIGYVTAAARLTGYRYAGPVAQTPDEFESALFISDRQFALFLPRPNRVLPAVLAPSFGVIGELEAQDFDRRPVRVLATRWGPLAPTTTRPLFITLAMRQPDPDPQLGLVTPWLRAPALVFAGEEFTVELEARTDLQRSFVQLQFPRGSQLASSFSAGAVKVGAGETFSQAIVLKPKSDTAAFEREELTLRVSLEGDTLEIPLEARPLASVGPLTGRNGESEAKSLLGELAPAGPQQRATASGRITAGYSPERLVLTIQLEDDRFLPLRVGPGVVAGDQLLVGIAKVGGPENAQVRVDFSGTEHTLTAVYGTPQEAVRGWTCDVAGGEGTTRTIRVTAPANAVGAAQFAAGQRWLLAVRYVDDDADGFAPQALEWGGGLDGGGTTTNWRWVKLVEPGTSPTAGK